MACKASCSEAETFRLYKEEHEKTEGVPQGEEVLDETAAESAE